MQPEVVWKMAGFIGIPAVIFMLVMLELTFASYEREW